MKFTRCGWLVPKFSFISIIRLVGSNFGCLMLFVLLLSCLLFLFSGFFTNNLPLIRSKTANFPVVNAISDKYESKLVIQKIGSFVLSPGSEPHHFAAYIPGTGGQPAVVQLRRLFFMLYFFIQLYFF